MSLKEAAAPQGSNRRTAYNWLERDKEGDEAPLRTGTNGLSAAPGGWRWSWWLPGRHRVACV
jgi:hypothetical protein